MRKRVKTELLPFAAAIVLTLAGLSIHRAMARVLYDASAPILCLWLIQMGTLYGVLYLEVLVSLYRGSIQGNGKLVLYLFLVLASGAVFSWRIPVLYHHAPHWGICLVIHLLGAWFGASVLACCITSNVPEPPIVPALPEKGEVTG